MTRPMSGGWLMERCCWSAQVCVKLHGDLRSSFLTSFSEEKRVQVYTFNRHNEHNQAVLEKFWKKLHQRVSLHQISRKETDIPKKQS